MMTKARTARKINATGEGTWEAVSNIGRLDVWFPSIEACRVEGSGVGARRFLTFANGGAAEDHIEEIDHAERRLVYRRTKHPFPVTSYRGAVEVFQSFDGLAVVVWTVDFDSAPESSGPVKTLLESGIGAALIGMDRDLSRTA